MSSELIAIQSPVPNKEKLSLYPLNGTSSSWTILQELNETSLLACTCYVIIKDKTYEDIEPLFKILVQNISKMVNPDVSQEIQFHQWHLENLEELTADLKKLEPIHLNPVLHWAHTITTGINILLIRIAVIITFHTTAKINPQG